VTELAQLGARWSEKLLHRRFVEVQLSDETHRSVNFKPTTTLTKPSRIYRLDLLVVDNGLLASDTLPGGVKHGWNFLPAHKNIQPKGGNLNGIKEM